jgi:hypothetical protein
MKLNYITQPTDLGGTAVPGCGTIHQNEIKPTLHNVSNDLKLSFSLTDYLIGSTGKREYSGDIDVVIDTKLWTDGINAFRELLEETFGKENVARNGDMLHLKYGITNYNPIYDAALPRTGFVQIDFNFGDPEWERFYHFSDINSAYKGGHRNLIIAAICSTMATEVQSAPGLLVWSDDTPIRTIRWKWGPKGFIQVVREMVPDKHGYYTKKQDTIISGPCTTMDMIMFILLPESTSVDSLNSLETIMDAVKENYGMVDQERIWKRTAENFSNWNQGKLFNYPLEISRYFLANDK